MKIPSPYLSVLGIAVLASLGSSSRSFAQTWIKASGTGNWNDAANWSGSVLPVSSPSETRVVSGNVEVSAAGAQVYSLFIAGSGQGGRGTATITVRDGASLTSANAYLGYGAGSNGTVNVTGAGSTWTNTNPFYLSMSGGTGALNITAGGTMVTQNLAFIGYVATNAQALISGTNSLWSAQGGLFIGAMGGQGTVTIENGGTLRTAGNGTAKLVIGYSNDGSHVNSGTVNIGSGGAAGNLQAAGIIVSAGSSGKLNFNHSGSAYAFSGSLEGNLAVEQKGSGTTILTGNANTYTGGTTVTGGKLVANNASGSAFGTGSVLVNANTTLAGIGRFTGSATILGTFAPGNSVGTMTTGNLTIGTTGIYEWEINKADGTAGNSSGGWDLAVVNGNLSFEPGATLSIESLGLGNLPGLAEGFDDGTSHVWTIATATGTISGVENLDIDTSGFQNSFTGTFSLSTSGNQVQLSYLPVPEPAGAALFAIGVLALAGGRRRSIY